MKNKNIQVRTISQKFIHPKFDPKFDFDNDIGIVKVNKAFGFSQLVDKIDLPIQDYEPKGKLTSKLDETHKKDK
jgi:hypothetical protein